ncbi:hypothetical protein F5Y19DRAFT_469431 [Xylariaceae sp. FL1651]|nr:hypothetical protein F5Y19DRAFT_469431 [Xylariaceae sp. FL1651]
MDPPPYTDSEGYNASDIVQPGILVLAGRLVHSESTNSTVLYELDHVVSFLSRADHKVAFCRHDRRVRTDRYGEVRVTSRERHIFNLESPHAVTSTSPYAFYLTSVSRRTLGNVGLKKTSIPKAGFKAIQINRLGEEDNVLFEITRKDDNHEWWDNEGKRIAIEDHANDQLKMIITTPLPRDRADVAVWCLRLWHDAVVDQNTSVLGKVGKKLGISK